MARTDPQIPRILKSLFSVAEQVIKKVALDIVANLVKAPSEGGTPVDTGWARANWLVNIGTPFLQPFGTRDQAEAAGWRSGAPPTAGLGQGTIATYKLGPPVFISNNVPYITRLNDGSSSQAPRGFVQAAILRALTSLSTVGVIRV